MSRAYKWFTLTAIKLHFAFEKTCVTLLYPGNFEGAHL